jgi:response regulator RpfG family c-di-GMP phosphodiesterase
MPNLPIQVYIVDDQPSIYTAYARLVRSAKMQPRTFESVEQFMHADLSGENACVISDVRMPETSGLELPALLARAPVIFHHRARHTGNARHGAASRVFPQARGRSGARPRGRVGSQQATGQPASMNSNAP